MRKAKLIPVTLVVALLIFGFDGACVRQSIPQNLPPMAIQITILVDPGLVQAGFNYEGEFQPQAVTVATGGTVTWNNTDNKDHTVVSYDGYFNHRLQTGESFTYTFSQNGTFKYHDVLYDGMDGVVYVR